MSNIEEVVTTEKKLVVYPYSVVVKFRGEGKPYSFGSFDNDYEKEDWVVVETQQGFEMGQVQANALSVSKYGLHMPTKPVIRKATEKDHRDFEQNLAEEQDAFEICDEEIKDLGLEMHLLSAQYTLDRTKILFVYLADQRVDFRELLKRLGAKLHCRIELRQIGERDKAKMVGGIGTCGMECCCSRFKTHFDVISINMAKNQLLALNIDNLSGMCGKLKCCLKYEDEDYRKLTEGLPKLGSQVEYEGEIYRVTNMNVMSEEAKLENHQASVFITLDDLRNKAIPRKGVVMNQKKEEGSKKIIKKTTTSQTNEKHHVSYNLETPEMPQKKEVRVFGKKKPSTDKPQQTRDNHRPQRKETKPNANVTVRVFGKKKKEGE